jgi:hypothetical protein
MLPNIHIYIYRERERYRYIDMYRERGRGRKIEGELSRFRSSRFFPVAAASPALHWQLADR